MCCMCVGCEGDGNAGVGSGVGVGAVSAYMSGTRRSGVLSSAGDVLEMSVVRGVSGVCDMCMCLARAGWEVVGDRIELGLYQFWWNMGKVGYMCVFGCRGVGGVGGEWVGVLGKGLGVWYYICVCCESGFSVLMAEPGIYILC